MIDKREVVETPSTRRGSTDQVEMNQGSESTRKNSPEPIFGAQPMIAMIAESNAMNVNETEREAGNATPEMLQQPIDEQLLIAQKPVRLPEGAAQAILDVARDVYRPLSTLHNEIMARVIDPNALQGKLEGVYDTRSFMKHEPIDAGKLQQLAQQMSAMVADMPSFQLTTYQNWADEVRKFSQMVESKAVAKAGAIAEGTLVRAEDVSEKLGQILEMSPASKRIAMVTLIVMMGFGSLIGATSAQAVGKDKITIPVTRPNYNTDTTTSSSLSAETAALIAGSDNQLLKNQVHPSSIVPGYPIDTPAVTPAPHTARVNRGMMMASQDDQPTQPDQGGPTLETLDPSKEIISLYGAQLTPKEAQAFFALKNAGEKSPYYTFFGFDIAVDAKGNLTQFEIKGHKIPFDDPTTPLYKMVQLFAKEKAYLSTATPDAVTANITIKEDGNGNATATFDMPTTKEITMNPGSTKPAPYKEYKVPAGTLIVMDGKGVLHQFGKQQHTGGETDEVKIAIADDAFIAAMESRKLGAPQKGDLTVVQANTLNQIVAVFSEGNIPYTFFDQTGNIPNPWATAEPVIYFGSANPIMGDIGSANIPPEALNTVPVGAKIEVVNGKVVATTKYDLPGFSRYALDTKTNTWVDTTPSRTIIDANLPKDFFTQVGDKIVGFDPMFDAYKMNDGTWFFISMGNTQGKDNTYDKSDMTEGFATASEEFVTDKYVPGVSGLKIEVLFTGTSFVQSMKIDPSLSLDAQALVRRSVADVLLKDHPEVAGKTLIVVEQDAITVDRAHDNKTNAVYSANSPASSVGYTDLDKNTILVRDGVAVSMINNSLKYGRPVADSAIFGNIVNNIHFTLLWRKEGGMSNWGAFYPNFDPTTTTKQLTAIIPTIPFTYQGKVYQELDPVVTTTK